MTSTEQGTPTGMQAQDIWTIQRIMVWSTGYLEKEGSPTPRLDTELLLCHTLQCRRIDLYTSFDKPMEKAERDTFKVYLRRRAAGEPIAYILGKRDFWGRTFQVNPAVLIPRPETEHLVEEVLKTLRNPSDTGSYRILDIGTGSGCIAISLKLEQPHNEVEAWDVSPDALAVAQTNAQLLGASVTWRQRDVLQEESWQNSEPWDVIVSNPPYIAASEQETLMASVVKFEPHAALFAPEDGLQFYKIIAKKAFGRIKSKGWIFFEVGATQAAAVEEILRQEGWLNRQVVKDLSGHERVVYGQAPAFRTPE